MCINHMSISRIRLYYILIIMKNFQVNIHKIFAFLNNSIRSNKYAIKNTCFTICKMQKSIVNCIHMLNKVIVKLHKERINIVSCDIHNVYKYFVSCNIYLVNIVSYCIYVNF